MRKTVESTKKTAEPLDTESLLRETALKLRGLLRSVAGNGNGEHDSTIKNAARLGGAITQVCGELRQHAKGRRRALAEFPIGDIVDYLRALPKHKRDDAFLIAFGADESEPLL